MSSVVFDQQPRADPIQNLPTDPSPPSPSESQILDTLFKEKQGAVQKVLDGTKDILVAGLLFILFSLPQTDEYIRKFFPALATSPYILLFCKALAFMLIFFIIKNMYLVRKR